MHLARTFLTMRPIHRHLMPRLLLLTLLSLLPCSEVCAQLDVSVPLPLDLENVPGAKMLPKPGEEAAKAGEPASAAEPIEAPPLPTTVEMALTGPVAQLYLYIEPYQTRVEALFDLRSIHRWLYPTQKEPPASLDPTLQQQIVRESERRAADWCSLSTNEGRQPYTAPAAFFVKGRPGATLNACMLGLVWQFTTNETPDEVEALWKGWINEQRELPVQLFFGNNPAERAQVNNVTKRLVWQNKGRLRPAPLVAVPTFAPPQPLSIPLGSILWVVIGLGFYSWMWKRDYRLPGGSIPYIGVWIFGFMLFGKLLTIQFDTGGQAPTVTEAAEAQKIISPLLRNVYRAFDHRAEPRIYDVLARSVDGELLRRLYLETIQALTLDGREGTRVLITDFEASVDAVKPHEASGGFIAEANWSVLGNVGHWGHAHPRFNGYKARLTLEPRQGEWKLTGLDVQEVRRK
jgi:hypothetical protein